MQFKAAGSVMVLASLAACFPTARDAYKSDVDRTLLVAPTPDRQVAAVGPLIPHPWKVGQWATYRTPDPGYETLSVVAIDTCGTWLSYEEATYSFHTRWLICMRAPASEQEPNPVDLVQLVVVTVDDGTPALLDFRASGDKLSSAVRGSQTFARLVGHLMPAAWQGDTSLRETIDVPAGHFAMTVRSTEVLNGMLLTNWTHPDVPFDGRVWTKTADGRSFPLVAYGETGAPSIVPERAAPRAVPSYVQQNRRPKYRDFVGVGAMSSWFTGLAGESSSTADGLEVRDGVGMTSSLDFVGHVAWSSLHHYSPDPSMSETSSRIAFGIHWRPFAKDARPVDRFSLENFYVLADLGYARLDRWMGDNRDEVTSGFAAGAGAGWTLHLTRGLAFGAEVSDHALFFTNDDITAHNLAATVLADVYPWW